MEINPRVKLQPYRYPPSRLLRTVLLIVGSRTRAGTGRAIPAARTAGATLEDVRPVQGTLSTSGSDRITHAAVLALLDLQALTPVLDAGTLGERLQGIGVADLAHGEGVRVQVALQLGDIDLIGWRGD